MTDLTLSVVEGETRSLCELDARLVAFNKRNSAWGSHYFTIELRDGSDRLTGGAGGRINLGAVEIRTLWLDEDLRGAGWGRRLVEAVMEYGRSLGAAKVMLDTYDFQARGFYESIGFSVFGTMEFPTGNKRFFLCRDL